MIGRQYQQNRVGTPALRRVQSSQRNGRRGIARARLEQKNRLQSALHRAVLVTRCEYVFVIGHRDNGARTIERRGTLQRLLQQTLPVSEPDKRLRIRLARHRPQPRTDAAGKDYGNQHLLIEFRRLFA